MPEPKPSAPLTRTRWEIRPDGGGPPIRGDLRLRSGAEPTTAVVICHGFKGFREWGFFPALAKAAAARGHAAVSFDFSHNGVGEDGVDFSRLDLFARNTHTRELEEIHRVVDAVAGGALFSAPVRSVGLFGHSRGGAEAVLAADEGHRVDALVTWAAISDIPSRWGPDQVAVWEEGGTVEIANARTGQQMPVGPGYWADVVRNHTRLDVTGAAARLRVPWLIVHGDRDGSVPVTEGRALYDAAGDDAELLVVEGGDHTFGAKHPYAGATPELRTAAGATLDWFDRHLAGGG